MDRSKITFAVYDPPSFELPYLSVIFMPGREEPLVATFPTRRSAEEFNEGVERDMATVSARSVA